MRRGTCSRPVQIHSREYRLGQNYISSSCCSKVNVPLFHTRLCEIYRQRQQAKSTCYVRSSFVNIREISILFQLSKWNIYKFMRLSRRRDRAGGRRRTNSRATGADLNGRGSRLTNRFHANYVNIGLSGFRSLSSYLVCLSKFQLKGSGEENVYFSCVIENWRRRQRRRHTGRRMWKVSPARELERQQHQQVDPVRGHFWCICIYLSALIWSTPRIDPVNWIRCFTFLVLNFSSAHVIRR